VVATQMGDEFNLDSLLLNNITDDDLYKTFLNTENEGNELALQPSLSLDNQYGQEISGLDGLDLGGLDFLQDPVIKLEPQQEEDLQSSPINTQNVVDADVYTANKRKMPREVISNKKPKIVKQEAPLVPKREDKYQKRLIANKKSAQASRERKKALKIELEKKVLELSGENSSLATSITELQTENKVLKGEFVHLQKVINDSAILSKIMARANMDTLPAPSFVPFDEDDCHSIRKLLPVSTPLNTAACMYLMIVLYSFSQHFTNTRASALADFPSLSTSSVVA